MLDLHLAADAVRRFTELQRSVYSENVFSQVQEVIDRIARSHHTLLDLQIPESVSESLLTSTRTAEQLANQLAPSLLAAQQTADLVSRQVHQAQAVSANLPSFQFAGLQASLDAAQALAKSLTLRIDIDQWKPFLESIDRLVVEAPNEAVRRLTLQATMEAVFEAATGTDLEFGSPKKVLKFWLILALFIFLRVLAYHQEEMHRVELGEVRRLQREQAETVAVLTETVRQMTGEIATLKGTPAVYLEISADGTLREAPSGQSPRVTTLRRGQVVRLLSTWKRWRYIELLDDSLHGTEQRGWLYRRQARPHGR